MRQLNIELHVSESMGLADPADLRALLRHAWVDHGFRVFSSVTGQGWTRDRKIAPSVLRRGVLPNTCCYNLQMVRGSECRAAVKY